MTALRPSEVNSLTSWSTGWFPYFKCIQSVFLFQGPLCMFVCFFFFFVFSATELYKRVPVQTNSFFVFTLRLCLTLQVRREYRKFFRANAGRKIYEFTLQRLVCIYLYKAHVHFLWFTFLFPSKSSSCIVAWVVLVRKRPS